MDQATPTRYIDDTPVMNEVHAALEAEAAATARAAVEIHARIRALHGRETMKPKRRYNWGALIGAPTDRYKAFNGGHQAKINGIPLEKNPFDQDGVASELWVAWREGWLMSEVLDKT